MTSAEFLAAPSWIRRALVALTLAAFGLCVWLLPGPNDGPYDPSGVNHAGVVTTSR